jgi:hypothetical protein
MTAPWMRVGAPQFNDKEHRSISEHDPGLARGCATQCSPRGRGVISSIFRSFESLRKTIALMVFGMKSTFGLVEKALGLKGRNVHLGLSLSAVAGAERK